MNASLVQKDFEHLADVGVEISLDDKGLVFCLYLEQGTNFFRKKVRIGLTVFRRSFFGITEQILHEE